MFRKLAVIGTAGRKSDGPKLTDDTYTRMCAGVIKFLDHNRVDKANLKLLSGGAAWADHVVVSLCLDGICDPKNLTLYIPAPLGHYRYEGTDKKSQGTADTANYYHKKFSDVRGIDSLDELALVKNRGATLEVIEGGFFARNVKVADALGADGTIVAFTFGDDKSTQPDWTIRSFSATKKAKDAGLKDGGTAHTFDRAKCVKFHARIGFESPLDISI